MRTLPLALALALGATLLAPRSAAAQDAPLTKEQAAAEQQRRAAEERQEAEAKRRLDAEKSAAAAQQKQLEAREKELAEQRQAARERVAARELELEKLRPQRVASPYVDPPDLAFGPFGSTALTMQSPRPRTRVYLAMDNFGWGDSARVGYPYREKGWGLAGRAGGELAFGRLSFGGDVPWLFYNNADTDRLGFGDFTLFTKLHIFGRGKYDAKSYVTSMLRLTFPTHFPKEQANDAGDDLSGEGYPVADDFYTKIEIAALVGHTLARRFSFGAQAGLVLFVGTGDLGSCPYPVTTGGTPNECRADTHVGFDGHVHVGVRVFEALDLHLQAGGVSASGTNFANGGYVGGSINLNLGSFRISAGAVVPLNDQLQRLYKWLATLSISWELHQYRRAGQGQAPGYLGQPALVAP